MLNNYWVYMKTFKTLKNIKSLISKKPLTEEEERKKEKAVFRFASND